MKKVILTVIALVMASTASASVLSFNCIPGSVGMDDAGVYKIGISDCSVNPAVSQIPDGKYKATGNFIDEKVQIFVHAKEIGSRVWFTVDPYSINPSDPLNSTFIVRGIDSIN